MFVPKHISDQSRCYIHFEFLLKSSRSFHCFFTPHFLLWRPRIHDHGGFLDGVFSMRKASKKLLSCETSPVHTIPNRHNLIELRASPYGTRAEVGQPTKCDRCRTYRIHWSSGASDDFLQLWGGLLSLVNLVAPMSALTTSSPLEPLKAGPSTFLPLPRSLDSRKLLTSTALRKPSFQAYHPLARTS
jgi:hypothetical protein